MCGFAGIVSKHRPATESELRQMGSAIAHRGPDSDGVWLDDNAGVYLVHRRLAVIDTSENGHQPMHSRSGRYVLCFNGEIYNHLEIRNAIEKRQANIHWRGSSDTETILESIEQFGLESAIANWVGMFAFALWDRKSRTLTLGRDRFGEKPLYYGSFGQRLLFGSELKALHASEYFTPDISLEALSLYFRYHYVPAPYTIFSGIHKLNPGSIAEFSVEQQTSTLRPPTITRYWNATSVANHQSNRAFKGDLAEAAHEVRNRLIRSINEQSVADVSVGAFLSGGIDSSAVVGLMQSSSTRPVKTFSIGFAEEDFNEAHHAKQVAQHLRTEHTELYLQSEEALDLLPYLATLYDEPFADASQIPTFAVCKLAREQVTVCLSGDGGDELFGGYTRYENIDQALKARHRLGNIGNRAAGLLARSPLLSKNITGQLRFAGPVSSISRHISPIARAIQLLAHSSESHTYQDMLSFWRDGDSPVLSQVEPDTAFIHPNNWHNHRGNRAAAQMIDTLTYLPDEILVKVDRAAMSVSLETRLPLLDHRLAEFVWTLPTDLLTRNAKSACTQSEDIRPKQILFDIACSELPATLIDRPKMGFGVPLGAWLRGPLKAWAESLIEPAYLRSQALLNPATVAAVWQKFLAGDDQLADHVWGILVFQAWFSQYKANLPTYTRTACA